MRINQKESYKDLRDQFVVDQNYVIFDQLNPLYAKYYTKKKYLIYLKKLDLKILL